MTRLTSRYCAATVQADALRCHFCGASHPTSELRAYILSPSAFAHLSLFSWPCSSHYGFGDNPLPPRLIARPATAHCSAADLHPNLARGVPGHTIHNPRSDRTRAMVRRHSSYGRRDEGKGRIRIT
jgi:hypothetical protein